MRVNVTIDTSSLQTRLLQYVNRIKTEMAAEMPVIAKKIQEDVRKRTPDPDTEYETIMGGHYHGTFPPRSGDVSSDPDSPRQRFNRAPGDWLQNLVSSPANVWVQGLSISIGHKGFLTRNSAFSWTDKDRKGQVFFYTSTYGVWDWFEYGGVHAVKPINARVLLPNPKEPYHVMVKYYPPYDMHATVGNTFYALVKEKLAQIQF